MKTKIKLTTILLLLFTFFSFSQTKTINTKLKLKNTPLASNGDKLVAKKSNGLVVDTGILIENISQTDSQNLTLNNNILTLEDGGSVDLTPYLDNQTITLLSLSNDILTITLENGNTETVDLSNYATDADVAANTNNIATNTTDLNNKVSKSGDTVTGDLNIQANLDVINSVNSTKLALNVANFAKQTDYGNEPIGMVFHHYTNGRVFQIDNVGENNDILVLKNAINPSRRTDKPSDFFGSGNFLKLLRQDSFSNDELFVITKDAKFLWKEQNVSPEFITDKTNTGFGFIFKHYKAASYPFALNTQGQYLFQIEDNYGRVSLTSNANRVNGIELKAMAGNGRIVAGGNVVGSFNSNGRVGIGTENPGKELEVVGSVAAYSQNNNFSFVGRDNSNHVRMGYNGTFGIFEAYKNNSATPMKFNYGVSTNLFIGDKIGVKTTNPLVDLDVNGTVRAIKYKSTNDVPLTTLAHNTTNCTAGTLQYKLTNNRLIVIGNVTAGVTGVKKIATLPVGARPSHSRRLMGFSDTPQINVEGVFIDTLGDIYVNLISVGKKQYIDLGFTLDLNY